MRPDLLQAARATAVTISRAHAYAVTVRLACEGAVMSDDMSSVACVAIDLVKLLDHALESLTDACDLAEPELTPAPIRSARKGGAS